jgi:hypothetical protein
VKIYEIYIDAKSSSMSAMEGGDGAWYRFALGTFGLVEVLKGHFGRRGFRVSCM